jgi:predicted acyltransferase
MLRDKGPALGSVGEFLGTQITHADWEGFRFYDFIFPLFIFITGVSIVLALPRLVEREGKAKARLHVLRRALFLYVLGVIYYGGVGQQLSDIRFVGILQRIAVCYLFASILFLSLDWRGLIGAVYRVAGGLLGAADIRSGARARHCLVSARNQPRQLGRSALPAGTVVG